MGIISQKEEKIKKQIAETQPGEPPNQNITNQQWVVDTLGYETRAAIRKKQRAEEDKEKFKKEILSFKVGQLKNEADEKYGDRFNRLVCAKLDQLEEESTPLPTNKSGLAYAEILVRKEIEAGIDNQAIEDYLSKKLVRQKEKALENLFKRGTTELDNPEKAVAFAAIMFEIEERKTDNIWQKNKFEETIIAGISGEPINLISVLCCINEYDYAGSFAVVPDLFAYLRNPKLEPIPLVVNELTAVRQFFEFYGIDTRLTIYVSDTEYTEVDKFSAVTPEITKALGDYVSNLRAYVSEKDSKTKVAPISTLTDSSLYRAVKEKVFRQVTDWKDPEFSQQWNAKFERYFEEMSDRIAKRKIFPANEVRKKSLDITRMRWAVNAAEGAVFGTLGPNTILASTEQRKRDQNYVIDKEARKKFPPVIYVLKAAEEWNKKLVEKDNQK